MKSSEYLTFGGVLILAIIALSYADEDSIRVIRQTSSEAPPIPAPAPARVKYSDIKEKYNLADPVSEDYPIIFNILLFVSVSLILAVIAISVAISTMDPGRDSLIYRVTSGQKSKKDN